MATVSIMGGVRLEVPPELRVEIGGFSLLGGQRVDTDEQTHPQAPVLRLRAFSLMGGIRVWTVSRSRRT
jgi:hypothetical protein